MVHTADIVVVGPEPKKDWYRGVSLSDLIFSKMKSRNPDQIIQVNAETGKHTSNHEFLTLSVQIAEALIRRGLQCGDIVVLAGRNSDQLHASALGTLFAGGVFAPVEPGMKPFEMRSLYQQLQPRFVICEPEVANQTTQSLKALNNDATVFIIDADANCGSPFQRLEDILENVSIDKFVPRPIDNPAENLALVACSSGSTGIPKGIGLSHESMSFQLFLWSEEDDLKINWPALQTSYYFWISGIIFSFLSYFFGTKRIFLRSITEVSILEAIDKYKPLWAMLPPAEVLSLLNFPDLKKYDVSSLLCILTGGSLVPKLIPERMAKEWQPGTLLVQGYGMTELSGMISFFSPKVDLMSVGPPAAGVSVKVIDVATGKSLGPHKVGEVLMKSSGLMRGYVGNEEETKVAIDEAGWCHSGDLGYYDEDGRIFIVDRIKEIIKFRNLQISPAEVEMFINSLPGIKEAAIVGIPHEKDNYHPMAIVVKLDGAKITAEEIIEGVKENLSDYKQLRAGVHFINALPRTATGKIKRQELKKMAEKLSHQK